METTKPMSIDKKLSMFNEPLEVDVLNQRYWLIRELGDHIDNIIEGATCPHCGIELTWKDYVRMRTWVNLLCVSCCNNFSMPRIEDPTDTQRELVANRSFFQQTFWHATKKPNWDRDIQNGGNHKLKDHEIIVHAGSKLSAMDRADAIDKDLSKRVFSTYLFSFRLTPEAIGKAVSFIADDAEDMWPESTMDHARNIWPQEAKLCFDDDGMNYSPHVEAIIDNKEHSVACYHNIFEDPGSLSILLTANSIDLSTVRRRTLNRSETVL